MRIDNYFIVDDIYDIICRIKSLLHNGKLHDVHKKYDEISVTCPCHKDGKENRPSCYVVLNSDKLEEGTFHCFTCGASGNFVQFVAHCFDFDELQAKKWLIDNYGKLIDSNIIELDKIELNSTSNKTSYLDESILDNYEKYHSYMTQRKLSNEVIDKFKLRYDNKSNCIVFPVWDNKNNLIFLTRRSVQGKQFYIDAGVEKPVYLLNYIEKYNLPYTIVCESQINALYCHSLNLSAVATFGCNMTDEQFELLNKSNIRHYILAFDGDFAGHHGITTFLTHIRKDVFISILKLPNKKDINDLSKEEVIKLLESENLNYERLSNIYIEKTNIVDKL